MFVELSIKCKHKVHNIKDAKYTILPTQVGESASRVAAHSSYRISSVILFVVLYSINYFLMLLTLLFAANLYRLVWFINFKKFGL